VQPIGCRLGPRPRAQTCGKQPYAAIVCRLMVATLVIHVITWISTQYSFTDPGGLKAELAWLVYPQQTLHPRSGHMSAIDQA